MKELKMYTYQTQISYLTIHAALCLGVVSKGSQAVADNNGCEWTEVLCFVFVIPVIAVYSNSVI